ncbi:hypothetical protein QUB12_10420 [Microcoleus sp. B7-D4]
MSNPTLTIFDVNPPAVATEPSVTFPENNSPMPKILTKALVMMNPKVALELKRA